MQRNAHLASLAAKQATDALCASTKNACETSAAAGAAAAAVAAAEALAQRASCQNLRLRRRAFQKATSQNCVARTHAARNTWLTRNAAWRARNVAHASNFLGATHAGCEG